MNKTHQNGARAQFFAQQMLVCMWNIKKPHISIRLIKHCNKLHRVFDLIFQDPGWLSSVVQEYLTSSSKYIFRNLSNFRNIASWFWVSYHSYPLLDINVCDVIFSLHFLLIYIQKNENVSVFFFTPNTFDIIEKCSHSTVEKILSQCNSVYWYLLVICFSFSGENK